MRIARLKSARLALSVGSGVFAAFLVAASPKTAAAQDGAFVIRLGRDTVAVEKFTRSATRLEGDIVYRQPRTTVRHYIVDFGPDGHVTRAEGALRQGGGRLRRA